MTHPGAEPERGRLAVGDAVELHTKFDGSWCAGFEIAEVRGGEYTVRRSRDRELLPEPTSADDLRAAPSIRHPAD